jgi:hypothetical protein
LGGVVAGRVERELMDEVSKEQRSRNNRNCGAIASVGREHS